MSSPRFCIVVPLFNHGTELPGTIERLLVFGLPILVVDDGSSDETRRAARDVAANNPGVELITLPCNQGKGAAVMAGMRVMYARGYSHAAQVDADGQHDIGRLPALLAAARKHPDALVSGHPQFDASMPAARRYGRRFNHFWVWIETLSTQIPDTMCGFRVYPLQSCIELMDSVRLGRRMDFDIEIVVRLNWRGVPFIPVAVDVSYPAHGRSHFRGLHDNLLITWLHIRLLCGLPLRAPALLWRRINAGSRHWSRIAERGSVLGMRSLLWVYRSFGRTAGNVVLYPVVAYFYCTGRRARQASARYLDRVRDTARCRGVALPAGLGVFRHMLSFGQASLDKVAVWAGALRPDAVRFLDPAFAARVRAERRGGIFIGSHLGNLEVCRAFGRTVDRLPIHALVYSRHAGKFNRILNEVNPEATASLIQVDTLEPGSLMRLQERIAAGEFIAIVGDRTAAGNEARSVVVDFLGAPAAFPEGPFVIASLLRCPVYLLFCLKSGDHHVVHLEPFADPLVLDREHRAARLQQAVSTYASRLEHHCLQAPLQWYNFFDFWAAATRTAGHHG